MSESAPVAVSSSSVPGGLKWHEWNDTSFELAQSENCPIFLLISSPHDPWCLKFEGESLADPRIREILDQKFVPMRVDPARRPDLDRRYFQGGRPSLAVLTPEGGLFFGSSFLAPRDLERALETAYEAFQFRKEDVEEEVQKWRLENENRFSSASLDREPPSRTFTQDTLDAIKANFDTEFQGFVEPRKRPLPDSLELLLYATKEWRDEVAASQVEKTLRTIQSSELWDSSNGGFYSACAGPGWKNPREIKSLMGNARLLRLYVEAFAHFGDSAFAEAGRKIGKFLLDGLFDPEEGAFRNHDGSTPAFHAASNGAAAWALLKAAALLEEDSFRARALDALRYIKEKLAAPDGGVYHYRTPEGKTPVSGQLISHIWPMRAYLEAYQAFMDVAWREEADRLAGYLFLNAWDREMGGFFDRWGEETPRGELACDVRPDSGKRLRVSDDLGPALRQRKERLRPVDGTGARGAHPESAKRPP